MPVQDAADAAGRPAASAARDVQAGPARAHTPGMTSGADAERHVIERLRTALASPYAVYANVRWTAALGPGRPAQDGEADVVIAHPERGLLVIEVKAGRPARDSRGRWFIGSHELAESPFKQADDNRYELVRWLASQPGWPAQSRPRAGHAVAFPDVDLASLPAGHALLGADADRRMVLDAQALETPAATRAWVDAAFAFHVGDGSHGDALGPAGMRLVERLLAPSFELHRLVRGRIADDAPALVAATRQQLFVLSQTKSARRVEIVGPAGSGKSMLAAEKARRLAAEGYRTLLVCFNQPLATALGRELADAADAAANAGGGLTVATFHRLAELLGVRAGVIAPHGPRVPDGWFAALPSALAQAVDRLPAERFHAVVVDEGQDFDAEWLLLIEQLLADPDEGVLWVFHDPGQALRGPDVVGQLALPVRLTLYENLRNPGSVAALANRFYRGDEAVVAYREDDPEPGEAARCTLITAMPGRETVEAVRVQLHRLLVTERVRPWDIVVLSGTSAAKSGVWAKRRFGNVELWNGSLNDDGSSRGLAPEDVPDEPPDDGVVRFETVRRFKGLERAAAIVCELPTEGERLEQLLYTALTRPTSELVVIVPPSLASRFRREGHGRGHAAAAPQP